MLSRCVVSYKLVSLVGTRFVIRVTRVQIVQESMLFKGEMKATVLENCHDLILRLMINAKAYKGANRKGSSRVTFHAPNELESR
jgi:hypothetical protein